MRELETNEVVEVIGGVFPGSAQLIGYAIGRSEGAKQAVKEFGEALKKAIG